MNAPFNPCPLSPEERAEIAREAEWEALRAEVEDEFRHGQRFDESREDADFSEWLVRMAQPHMRDCERYREAMDASERLSDAALMRLSAGQKRFQGQRSNT